MKMFGRVLTFLVAILIATSCSQVNPPKEPTAAPGSSPEVVITPTPETKPTEGKPGVSPQWFWEGSVWEKNGALDPWLRQVIEKDNPWILSNAKVIEQAVNGLPLGANAPRLDLAQQKWNAAENYVQITVPYDRFGSLLEVKIRPTWQFAFSSHTFEILRAYHLKHEVPSSGGVVTITRILPTGIGTSSSQYYDSTGKLLRILTSGGAATVGQLSTLGSSTLFGISSIEVVPVCPSSIVVDPRPCAPSKEPAECALTTSSVIAKCVPLATPDGPAPVLQSNCDDLNKKVKAAERKVSAARWALSGLILSQMGTCGAAVVSWATGQIWVGALTTGACVGALAQYDSYAIALEEAIEALRLAREEYMRKCG